MTDSGNERVQKFGYPAVALTAPEAGDTVSGTLEVSADAYDPDGVEGVRFELDGAALGNEDTSAPYSASWDTKAVADGPTP